MSRYFSGLPLAVNQGKTMSAQEQLPDFGMDSQQLYAEESYTDRHVGNIRVLRPVTASGENDPSRAVIYTGQTQVMTPAGALPLSFEIEANSLAEAVAAYGESARQALQRMMEELRELQREAASSIVVPGRDNNAFGAPGAGRPGGGIQFP